MFRKLLIASFMLVLSAVAFAQNKSVYSELTPKNCEDKSNRNVPELYSYKCKGVGGYDLEYFVNDARDTLSVVFPSKEAFGLNFYQYFRDFSYLGTKVEWRLKNNKPVALIVRLNVSDREDNTKHTSYLIISKITKEKACVIDVIDPIKDQNAKARKIADKALTKKCMPEFIYNEIKEDPAINALIGKDADELLKSPDIVARLKKLLGEKDYASFTEYLETKSPIKRDGDFLFASGCMTRACTRLESAFAYDVKNNRVHAAIFDQIKQIKFFNENRSQTPEIIANWAKRLENLKPDETQDEAILFDEFQYQNREDFMTRFDSFTNPLYDKPESKGYIIIYSDKKSYAKSEKEIKEYGKLRGLDSKRLTFLKGEGDSGKVLVQLWIVPKGAEPPTPRDSSAEDEVRSDDDDKPMSILIDQFSYANREDFLARFDGYSVELQNNPNDAAYIILKGDKDFQAKFKKEIIDYIRLRHLNPDRFVFLNGGDDKKSLIELWRVPQGAESPESGEKDDKNNSVESQIITLEKKAWEAWKNKNVAFFKTLLADDALSVNSAGVFEKAQILEFYASCKVKSYSLDDFKFRMLDKNSALITFTATQDAVCGGEKNPSIVRASSIYIKRGGKWLNIFYTETTGNK